MAILQNSINANASTPLGTVQGGTGVSSPTAHGILVAEGASAFTPIVLTNGQMLIGSTGADPVAAAITSSGSTLTVTTGAGTLNIDVTAPLNVAHGGTGLTTITAHGILVGEGTSAITPIVLTNGQLLIGSTGADPVAAAITAGSGITVTNGAGTITIASTGGGIPYSTVTTTSQAMAANNGYVANNAGLVTLTLPATAAVGDLFEVAGLGAGGWAIAQNASQLIHFGNQVTTTGTGGSIASGNQYDTMILRCIVTNTTFAVMSANGGPFTVA